MYWMATLNFLICKEYAFILYLYFQISIILRTTTTKISNNSIYISIKLYCTCIHYKIHKPHTWYCETYILYRENKWSTQLSFHKILDCVKFFDYDAVLWGLDSNLKNNRLVWLMWLYTYCLAIMTFDNATILYCVLKEWALNNLIITIFIWKTLFLYFLFLFFYFFNIIVSTN